MGLAEVEVGGAVLEEALVPLGNFFCPLCHILKFKYSFKFTSLMCPEAYLFQKSPVFLMASRKAAQKIF